MNTILVPVNFSASSMNAARYATELAAIVGGKLILLHVFQLPVSIAEASMSEGSYEKLQKDYANELQALRLELLAQVGNRKLEVETRLEIGTIEQRIEQVCQQIQPFVVVMGKTADSLGRLLMGSSTIFALSHLKYPLLIIPADAKFQGIHRIGIACDSRDIYSLPSEYLSALHHAFRAEFDVIDVRVPNREPQDSGNELALIGKKLKDIAPKYQRVQARTVEEGLQRYLEHNPIDLLLVIPQRHDIFEFHKSHSKSVARRSTIPILSIHQ